jgi:hypothetical protein
MRDKWDSRRGQSTYGSQTIEKALGYRTEFYNWRASAQTSPNGNQPIAGGQDECWTDEKNVLRLPPVPEADDLPGLCRWLTTVLDLNPHHPVIGASRYRLRGADGRVCIHRAGDVEPITFAPARHLNNAPRFIETLSWQLLRSDGKVRDFKATHCRDISYVARVLSDDSTITSDKQLAEAIVGDLMAIGEAVSGRTSHGTGQQSYEAALALSRPHDETTGRQTDQPRYLIDAGRLDKSTGELIGAGEIVIAVNDLQLTARKHVGSSLAHGWLDGLMDELGWTRIRIEGHERPRPDQGLHRGIDAYRGHLHTGDQETTNA